MITICEHPDDEIRFGRVLRLFVGILWHDPVRDSFVKTDIELTIYDDRRTVPLGTLKVSVYYKHRLFPLI